MVSCSFDSFDGENEVWVGRDGANSSASVGCLWGTQNLDPGSNVQAESNFVPADDNLSSADSEGKRASSVKARVENLSILELSLVVHLNIVTFLRLGSLLTSLNNLDAIFLGKFFREECGAEYQEESKNNVGLH